MGVATTTTWTSCEDIRAELWPARASVCVVGGSV